jgi:serine phosphatase RsbU (regulator of sigma subunit)
MSSLLDAATDTGADVDALAAELLDRYEEVALLHGLSKSMSALFDEESLCEVALRLAAEAIGCERAWIALQDNESDTLRFTVTRNADALTGKALDPSVGITAYVASSGRRVLLHLDEGWPTGVPQAGAPVDALLSVPLIAPALEGGSPTVLGAMTLMGRPRKDRFTAGHSMLAATVSGILAASIHNSRLMRALGHAEDARRQMELAAQVQQSLLPSRPPDVPGVATAGLCVAAANVGGDYYDFIVDAEGRLTLLIADVTGHSVGSALMMAAARGIMRREVLVGNSPSAVLAATNEATLDDLTNAGLFITMFCARYEPATGVLRFSSGGHNPPLLRTTAGIEELDPDGMPAGLMGEVEYEEHERVLRAGDQLLLYTDGCVEARDPAGVQFGLERLVELMAHAPDAPDVLVRDIYAAVDHYTEGHNSQDDLTLVALTVLPDEGGAQ